MRVRSWWLASIILLVVALCGETTYAQAYSVGQVPNVQLTDSRRLTSDPSGILSSSDLSQIDAALDSIRSRYGVEFVVVVLPSIGEQDIEGFSTELFRQWGIGHKQDNNGLLMLIVMDQRKVRFEVGYGLEGDVTDAISAQIQRRLIIPHFKRGEYGAGILSGVQAVDGVLSGTDWTPREKDDEREIIDGTVILFFYLFFIAIVFLWSSLELSTRIKSVQTPQQARRILPQLKSSFANIIVVALVLMFPLALVFWLWRKRTLPNMERMAAICPRCSTSAMQRLGAREGNGYLDRGQSMEQTLGSCRYDVWQCSSCHEAEIKQTIVPNKQYKACPSCLYHTLTYEQRADRIMLQGKPYVRLYRKCLNCGHTDGEDHRDHGDMDGLAESLLLSALLGSNRSYRGGFSGGGFSGGFGGGFGGGASGGGGATSGW